MIFKTKKELLKWVTPKLLNEEKVEFTFNGDTHNYMGMDGNYIVSSSRNFVGYRSYYLEYCVFINSEFEEELKNKLEIIEALERNRNETKIICKNREATMLGYNMNSVWFCHADGSIQESAPWSEISLYKRNEK